MSQAQATADRTGQRPMPQPQKPTAVLAPQLPSEQTTLLQALIVATNNPAIDIDKLERLFKMYQDMAKTDIEAKFNGALSRAQAKILPIATNETNTHTSSRYADLAAINAAIVPLYTAEGLSLSFNTEACPTVGWVRTVGILAHEAGGSRRYELDLPSDAAGAQGKVNKTGVQAAGSTNSYARRYLTRMIFNLSTYDDDDGNTNGNGNGNKPPQQAAAKPTPMATEKPGYPADQFTKNLPAWEKAIANGRTASQIIETVQSKYVLTEQQIKDIKSKEKK